MMGIIFKSIPENWEKEKDGRKPNTFRKLTNEIKFECLRDGSATYVEMVNVVTKESFKRNIIDYTEWDGYAIISWKHEVNNCPID